MPFTSLAQAAVDIMIASKDQTIATPSKPNKEGWIQLSDRLSNFDRKIPIGLEDQLKVGGCFCIYAAWDFGAEVWWEDNVFHAFVRVYRVHKGTIVATTLEKLMNAVSDEFGYD